MKGFCGYCKFRYMEANMREKLPDFAMYNAHPMFGPKLLGPKSFILVF